MNGVQNLMKDYHLVIDNSKSSDEVLYIRASLYENQLLTFVEQLREATGTVWYSHTDIFNSATKKFEFCKAWVCYNANFAPIKEFTSDQNGVIKMEIIVKEIKSSTKRYDTFLLNKPPLTGIIRFTFNYHCKCKWFYKNLKVHDDIQEVFFSYFDKGCSTTQAKKLFIEDRHRIPDFKINNFVPSKRRLSYLYATWRERVKNLKNPLKKLKVENSEFDDTNPGMDNEVSKYLFDSNIITSKLSSDAFDFKTFINTIPRVNPPIKATRYKCETHKDIVDFDNESNLIKVDSKTSLDGSLWTVGNTEKDISVNSILASKNLNISSSCQNEAFTLNASSNHINDSVNTVNCSGIISSSLSSLNGGKLIDITTSQTFRDLNVNTSSSTIMSVFDTKGLNPSENSISHDKKSVLFEKNEQNSDFPFTPLMFPDISKESENSVSDIEELKFDTESNGKNITDLSRLSANHINTIQSPFCTSSSSYIANELSGSASIKSQNIHITNTAHQSGAYISMKPIYQTSKALNTVCFSNCESSLLPLVGSKKIKEKQEIGLDDLKEPSLPIISEVFSLSGKKNEINEEPLSVSAENGNNNLCCSITSAEDTILEDDQDFLLSLLPKLGQISNNDVKRQIKLDIKTLISATSYQENIRKYNEPLEMI